MSATADSSSAGEPSRNPGRRRRGRLRRSYDTSRLMALSDGVYAIAMTLLVLNLTVPTGTADSGLGQALRDLEPELYAYAYAYALTVLVLGAFWIAHHRLLVDVPRVTERVLWINVLYLGLIAPTTVPDRRTRLLRRPAAGRDAVRRHHRCDLSCRHLPRDRAAARRTVRFHHDQPVERDPILPPVGLVFLATVPLAWWRPALATWLWILAVFWPPS
jgi:hypothetical protein